MSKAISVDFCRGSAGPFLGVNNVVVAGDLVSDGSARVIQSFVADGARLERALGGAAGTAPAVEAAKRCPRCDVFYPDPAPAECDHCGGVVA